jgi:hypothetical protein
MTSDPTVGSERSRWLRYEMRACRGRMTLIYSPSPGGEGRGFDSRGSAGEGVAELLSVFDREPPGDHQVIETIVPR